MARAGLIKKSINTKRDAVHTGYELSNRQICLNLLAQQNTTRQGLGTTKIEQEKHPRHTTWNMVTSMLGGSRNRREKN